jgi:hypothetical protein
MKIKEFMKEIEEKGTVEESSEIVELKIAKASEFFGVDARYPERDILHLRCKNGATLNSSASGISTDGKLIEVVDQVLFFRSIKNELSKLGKFIKRYGEPKLGLRVQTQVSENGFLEIVV